MRATRTESHPVAYLTPHPPSFWRWERDSVVFASGPTLTFREELFAVIRHLQPFGLPPVESLLLFLAATRDPWPRVRSDSLEHAWRRSLEVHAPEALSAHLPEGWRERVSFELGRIHALPKPWRSELPRKCVLAEVCFAGGRWLSSPDEARGVESLLERGFVAPPEPPEVSAELGAERLAEGLGPLLEGLPSLTEERLLWRWRTGLDAPLHQGNAPEEALPQQVRSLLKQLEGEREWGGLVKLTRALMASVRLPRALSDPERLQVGGVSDVTNRGPLDRLLLSELAQDDLVFSARLALNEALFLRREAPPGSPENRLMILIDNGILLWGLPRLFATATALAMEAVNGKGRQVSVYVPTEHQQLRQVELHTREGLMEALSHVHAHAHPGNACLELARLRKSLGEAVDWALITHPDVWRDEAFRAALGLLQGEYRAVTVDREGKFALYHCQGERQRVLKTTRLDLKALLRSPVEATILRRHHELPVSLPPWLRRRPFPIRLPSSSTRGQVVLGGGHGVLKVLRDGRLLHFDDPKKGGIEICDDLPAGVPIPVWDEQGLPDGRCLMAFKVGRWVVARLVDVRTGAMEERRVVRSKRKPRLVLVVHQHLLVVSDHRVTVHGLRRGGAIAEMALPGRVRGVYLDRLYIDSQWYRVGLDGLRPCLERDEREVLPLDPEVERFQKADDHKRHFAGIHVDGKRVHFETGMWYGWDGPRTFEIMPSHGRDTLVLTRVRIRGKATGFEDVEGPRGSRVRYQQVEWREGSRVIQDSRGLLHFHSSDEAVEDFTLVFSESGEVSAWLGSAGGVGDPYYFHGPPEASSADLLARLETFASRVNQEAS